MGGSGSKASESAGPAPPSGPDLFAELGVALLDRPKGTVSLLNSACVAILRSS